ncbi:MAG: sulfite exporter TauE/SafE family protein [Verrucomicrobiales bacterium]|nr:sulfite exporter TauE/SafE family protein [Verrucomicrobiales bacterium]
MGDPTFWLTILLLGAAAFVQSATGFGLAIVCMAGLPLMMTVRDAVTLTAMLNLVVCVGVIMFNRQGISLKKCWPLIIAISIGIPIGYYGLRSFNDVWVTRILGVVLISIALTEFLRKEVIQMSPRAGIPICIGGGILGGAFNVGGPPIVAYVYSQDWSKIQMVAILQTVFLASGLVRNGLMFIEGDTTLLLVRMLLFSIPAVVIGIWIGKIVLDRTPLVWLKKVVFAAVFAIGVFYIKGSIAK